MTDLSTLACPAIPAGDRERDIADQWVRVNPAWWNNHLATRTLAGGPLRTRYSDERGHHITRADVWSLATDVATDDDAALALLWHALAWGAGFSVRNEPRRMDAVKSDRPRAVAVLREAAALAAKSPTEAYQVLHPDGRGAIKRLGPAFGTKFLYFAGGGRPDHPSLILDKRVATRLHALGWASLPTGTGWLGSAYGRYCDLAARWAKELSTDSTPVAADQVERWLFGR